MAHAVAIIKAYGEQQKKMRIPCPRCGQASMDENLCMNTLSRRVDVYICNDCGTDEAIEDLLGCKSSLKIWKIVQLCKIRKVK